MNLNDIASSLPGLRRRAKVLLDEGRVPDAGRYNASEALRVLCRLALEQGTAPDALALLHELQVHQVELDLQTEELRASRTELEAALWRQTRLYECAPVALFNLDAQGRLRELNRKAEALLGAGRDELLGQPLARWLAPAGAAALQAALQALAADRCERQLALSLQGRAIALQARLGADPAGPGALLACLDATPWPSGALPAAPPG